MRRQQCTDTTDDVPAAMPAVVPPVDPLTESSADVWRRWSQDRQQRELHARAALEAQNQALIGPIYPRELGEAIAKETARMIPDWRLITTEHPGWVRKLITQQPDAPLRRIQARALARSFCQLAGADEVLYDAEPCGTYGQHERGAHKDREVEWEP